MVIVPVMPTNATLFTEAATVNPVVTSFNAVYAQGPIYVSAAWEKHKDIFRNYTGAAANVAGADERGVSLAGHVTFGPVRVGAGARSAAGSFPQRSLGWAPSMRLGRGGRDGGRDRGGSGLGARTGASTGGGASNSPGSAAM